MQNVESAKHLFENKANIYIAFVLNIKDFSMNQGFNVLNVIFSPFKFLYFVLYMSVCKSLSFKLIWVLLIH